MNKKIIVIFALFFVCADLNAQSDGTYDYKTEFIWGLNKSTTSGLLGGLIFRFGTASSQRSLRTIGFELINVRHPAEVAKIPGSSFKENKINYLYAIRGRYGKEFLLFKKSNQQGVQINAHFAGGPIIGLESPYYIQNAEREYVQYYDPDVSPRPRTDVAGAGIPFQGLFKSKIIPGLNAKGSMLFEFGTFKTSITGVEIGVNFDIYSRAPELQFQEDTNPIKNNSVYSAAFINIIYGKRK